MNNDIFFFSDLYVFYLNITYILSFQNRYNVAIIHFIRNSTNMSCPFELQ